MESENGLCRRGCRQMSPADGARTYVQKQPKVVARTSRRVQVVYYLKRSGQLEHPHYMELSLLPNQHLRLRDVMDRLIALRGKGMPSLYSWSSKRTYKNGYVWNDLLENDIIFPTDGAAEYVLKGSELIEGCTATESFQQLHVMQRKPMLTPPGCRRPEEAEEEEEDEDYEEYEEKTSSKGVSTEESLKNLAELTLDSDSPPPPPSSCTSSSDKTRQEDGGDGHFKRNDNNSDDRVALIPSPTATTSQVIPSRNSVLLQLIACGGSTSMTRAKTLKQVGANKKSDNGLHKGVLCKTAAAKMEEEEEEEEEDMIKYMSENPRFGNMQSEEKEYFSGSIVESLSSDQRVETQPVLKRSNSYNNEQERSLKIGMEEAEDEEEKREKAMKGKCIPRMKPSCAKQIKNGLN